jgi:hypothetical protein
MCSETISAAWIGAEAAVIGGAVAGLLSGAYQHLRDWYSRPQLVLEFDPKVDKFETQWDGSHPFNGMNIRASLRNVGRTPAINTRVFVAGIDAVHASGTTQSLRDSRQISWAGWDFNSRSVQKGITFYVDILRVSKVTSGWQFTFREQMAHDAQLKGYKGTYRFKLVVVADNAEPSHLSVDVEYDGDWNNLKAWTPS